jgi:hypothetical protein
MTGLPVFWGWARGKAEQTLGGSLSMWFWTANLEQPSGCPDYAGDIQPDTVLLYYYQNSKYLMRARQHIYIAWCGRAWSEESAEFEPFMPECLPSSASTTISRMSCSQVCNHLRPHDLRHRFGCWMAEKAPLYPLAKNIGHGSLNTEPIYPKRSSEGGRENRPEVNGM